MGTSYADSMPKLPQNNGRQFSRDQRLPPGVARNVVLSKHTSIHVGGPAKYFSRPESAQALYAQLSWAASQEYQVFILGGGTNVIVSDAGFDGLVICTRDLCALRIEGTSLIAEAGALLHSCVSRSSKEGLSGLEWAAGIPGTVGGAIAMNAGAFGGDIASVLDRVQVRCNDGTLVWLPASDLGLGYRTSAFQGRLRDATILVAQFSLETSTEVDCEQAMSAIQEQRTGKLPQGATAGCIFRNPLEGPSAGVLLDQAGCKGMRIGDAVVSQVHANVIVNEGTGNAEEVIELIERMRQRVRAVHSIELQEEVRFIPSLSD